MGLPYLFIIMEVPFRAANQTKRKDQGATCEIKPEKNLSCDDTKLCGIYPSVVIT